MTIKLDQVFRLKQKEVDDYKEKCDAEMEKVKQVSQDQMELHEKKLKNEKQFILKDSEQLKHFCAA